MASVPDQSDKTVPKNGNSVKTPGRIGVYERPEGLNLSSMLFAGLIGLVILALVALAVYVMLL